MKTIERDQLLDASVERDKTLRVLTCELTDDEQRERGVQSAAAYDEINRIKAEAKGIADEFKSKITGAEALHKSLKNAVLQKREYREVDCVEWHDYKKGKVYVVRDDTGAISETRNMTPEERQLVFTAAAGKLDASIGHPFKEVMKSKNCGLCDQPREAEIHAEKNRGVTFNDNGKSETKTRQAPRAATANA